MKKLFIICFIFLPLLVPARKQGQARIDSLLTALPKLKEDTNKVKLLDDLSANYSSVNPDEGIKYGQQGIKLAQQLGYKTGIAKSNKVIGMNYYYKSDYNNALEYNFRALHIYEETGNTYGIAAITNNVGLVYQKHSNYPMALEYYFKALKINE